MHTQSRRRLPCDRQGITEKVVACGYKTYVTVNFFCDSPDPGEVFITIAKEGSDLAGLFDVISLTISMALQYGVPWDVLHNKYLNTRFGINSTEEEPSVMHSVSLSISRIIERRKQQLEAVYN